jgi:hypothetical protein
MTIDLTNMKPGDKVRFNRGDITLIFKTERHPIEMKRCVICGQWAFVAKNCYVHEIEVLDDYAPEAIAYCNPQTGKSYVPIMSLGDIVEEAKKGFRRLF